MNPISKIMNRAAEPSSYGGLAAVLVGLDQLFDIKEAQPMADAASQAAEIVLATGNPTFGLAMLFTGILGIFMPERKEDGSK